MKMKITLVDLHGTLVTVAQRIGWSNIELRGWTDIREIKPEPGMAFVSPANSLGFMDGGIDYVLSRIMFPSIEDKVKAAFKKEGHTSLLGRAYLPIGKAVSVKTQYSDTYLIAAPTMWLPQDVRGTNNAYHAMYAILKEASCNKSIQHIILCGLCTGCGMVIPEEAVRQMYLAFQDFTSGYQPRYSQEQIVQEQPCVYMNTEFKDIQASHVNHVQ